MKSVKAGIAFFLVSWFCGVSHAQFSVTRAYYGREFYGQIKMGVRGPALRESIYKILSQVHASSADQGFDQIDGGCQQGAACYQHQSIGYDRARQFLMGHFYLFQDESGYGVREVYCERDVSADEFRSVKPGPNRIPDNRVVNAEHTWPQSRFTSQFSKEMQKSDLHHLFPTDSELNSARSSFPFGDVVNARQSLKCKESQLGSVEEGRGLYFEPPDSHKGNVARALFYFAIRYRLSIDPIQEKYLRKWHYEDLPDEEEMARNQAIFKLQGNRNPFIDHPELADLIMDF